MPGKRKRKEKEKTTVGLLIRFEIVPFESTFFFFFFKSHIFLRIVFNSICMNFMQFNITQLFG